MISIYELKALLQGLGLTLIMAFCAAIASIIFGSILAVLRNYSNFFKGGKIISKLVGIYVEIFRNTPLLIWMFACCFAVPMIISIPQIFNNYAFLGSFGLFLYTSSVMCEIIRGGLNSVSKGQFEAAASQGFTLPFTLWHIIFPQCFRNITPTLLSQCITTIKDTSFLAAVGVMDLMGATKKILGSVYSFSDIIVVFLISTALYFAVCFCLSVSVRYYANRKALN